MADAPKKDYTVVIIGAILTSVVGLGFVGFQTSEKNDQTQIDNLPAVVARLERVEQVTASTLTRTELEGRFTSINETLIRRFGEDVQVPIDQVRQDAEKNEDAIQDLAERIAALEAQRGK